MPVAPRRSTRSNKGQHSSRVIDRYSDDENENEVKTRKRSFDDGDDDFEIKKLKENEEPLSDSDSEDGAVRCNPCGATSQNFNEDTDQGGTMIECDSCRTWQHAKCMGFKSEKDIPKTYKCDVCDPSALRRLKKEKADAKTQSIVNVTKEPTRSRVAKAFFQGFEKNIDASLQLPQGYDRAKLANKWAFDLEAAIHSWAGESTDKKYIDKSRSLMVFAKKPTVIKRLLENDLSFDDMVNRSPEEIDDDLKKYAEKVRQESIRRSVLTVDDSQSARIRRTHKGEEIVESSNSQSEDVDVNIVSRNVDHRRFKEESPSAREIIVDNAVQSYNFAPDEDEEEHQSEAEQTAANLSDDDELDFILKEKPKEVEKPKEPEKQQPKLPNVLPADVWTGRIVFPDFASFAASASFYLCSHFKEPSDINTVIAYNKYIKTCKEIYHKDTFAIEGRLDRGRAVAYLNKVITSRDIFLVEVKNTGDDHDFRKIYDYLSDRQKVGVLSDRPEFVKDAYLLPLSGNETDEFISLIPQIKKGLFALYVVKRDHVPVGRSILKKTKSPVPASQQQPQQPTANLDSILSKLSGAPTPQESQGPLSSLSSDQLSFLSGLVQQNPHVQQNPQALIQLLQQQGMSP